MNSKKIISLFLCVCSFICIFVSCSSEEYSNAFTCKELSNVLMREISVPEGKFSQYSNEDIKFIFSSPNLYNDIQIIYSKDHEEIHR